MIIPNIESCHIYIVLREHSLSIILNYAKKEAFGYENVEHLEFMEL